jgi:tRNA (cmo5U34)-methyltransferase
MNNIFDLYPEFISTDPRIHRKNSNAGAYEITSNFQYHRHSVMLPPDTVAGKRVLDLGSCVGASGAWVLANGASCYVGLELQKKFCDVAKENLSNRFADANWQIREESFTDFFANNTEKFDIVIAFGVLYHNIYFETLIKNILSVDPDLVLIDSAKPQLLQNFKYQISPAVLAQLQNLPLVEYGNYHMVSEVEKYTVAIESSFPSLSAVAVIMSANEFELDNDTLDSLINRYPDVFEGRYYGIFKKVATQEYAKEFEVVYNSPDKQILQLFNSGTTDPWEFNSDVADKFDAHARQHIPDYTQVITKSINICKKLIRTTNTTKIIDVGCAVGETIKKLHEAGFHNLVGVDSSSEMLNKAKHSSTADWVESLNFPIDHGPYNAVLCNWTLHFIKDKISYLQDIYAGLLPGGFLILSDKTANSGFELELYHDFKRQQGVSEKEITAKTASVKNIMFINDANWYVDTLTALGFESVSVINAAPCFTTFLAKKKPA